MNIGIAGIGHWGCILAKNFSKYGNILYFDPNVKLISGYTREESFGKLVKYSDKVVVAVPAKKLYEYAKYSLSCGKDTFCEKPILNIGLFEDLVSQSELTGAKFFVDNLYNYNESINLFIDNIKDLSEIVHIDIDWYNGNLVRDNVNVFTDLGWHPLTILYKLIGSVDISEITAEYTDDGYFVTLFAETGDEKTFHIKLSWLDREKTRRVNVRLKDGTNFVWNEVPLSIVKYNNDGSSFSQLINLNCNINTVAISCREFLNCKDLISNKELTRWCSLITGEVLSHMGIGE